MKYQLIVEKYSDLIITLENLSKWPYLSVWRVTVEAWPPCMYKHSHASAWKCIHTLYTWTEYRPTERRRKTNNNRTPTNRKREIKDRCLGTLLTNGIDVYNKELTSLQLTQGLQGTNKNAKVWAGGWGANVNTKWESTTAQSRANYMYLRITTSIAKSNQFLDGQWLTAQLLSISWFQNLSGSENNSWVHSLQTTCQFQYTTYVHYSNLMCTPGGGVSWEWSSAVQNELFMHFACQDLRAKGLSQFNSTVVTPYYQWCVLNFEWLRHVLLTWSTCKLQSRYKL